MFIICFAVVLITCFCLFSHGSNESIWLFVKELTNSKAKEYKLKTVKNNSLVLEVPTDDFTIVSCSNRCFVVEDQKSKIQHRFLPPLTCYSSIHNKSVWYLGAQ